MHSTVFPFVGIVGQEELKLGLLLNAVNPAIGGVLIRGEKGTAKSTAVRALADLLPEVRVVAGCCFSCNPDRAEEQCDHCRMQEEQWVSQRRVRLVDLPLNATEDRVAGGIDFSRTLQQGRPVLQPGLLAEANRGILYIDEVNLLDDHLVDLILDAAGCGWNVVEREGLSFRHPAGCILIGTMNPEEGELRPQLLDRFGLCLEIQGTTDLDERVRLLERKEAFDADPLTFRQDLEEQSQGLRHRIAHGRRQLARLKMRPHLRSFIGALTTGNHVAGHRADLVMEQAALALAALEDSPEVQVEHIRRVAAMVLIHRQRDAQPPPPPEPELQEPEPEPPQDADQDQKQESRQGEPEQPEQSEPAQAKQEQSAQGQERQDGRNGEPEQDKGAQEQPAGGGDDQVFDVGATFSVRTLTSGKDRVARRGAGRRSRSRVSLKQGRYIKAGRQGLDGDIALDATIRAAAPHQVRRQGINGCPTAIRLHQDDLRLKIREKRLGNLLVFVVDASGSMGARGRMTASKGAVMSLLLDAYQKRDKVALVSFRRDQAWVNLPITGSVELAGKLLAEMPVGGRTPLSAGLVKGFEQVRNYLIREPNGRPIVIILTDGKANVSLGTDKPVAEMERIAQAMGREARARYIVVDTEEEGVVTFDLARRLASCLAADYFKTTDLKARELVSLVRQHQ
jgi:magnesium chelatase subunit D